MALYVKEQSWINAPNDGEDLDDEVNNIYASLVDLRDGKIDITDPSEDIHFTGEITIDQGLVSAPTVHIRDEKNSGTAGGTATSGSYFTRTLNTVKKNTVTGASLASNKVTLPAGTYTVYARVPGYAVDRHHAILYNVTDSAEVLYGTLAFTQAAAQTDSIIIGEITIAGTKDFEIRQRVQTTEASDGQGQAIGSQWAVTKEVYAEIIFTKTA